MKTSPTREQPRPVCSTRSSLIYNLIRDLDPSRRSTATNLPIDLDANFSGCFSCVRSDAYVSVGVSNPVEAFRRRAAVVYIVLRIISYNAGTI